MLTEVILWKFHHRLLCVKGKIGKVSSIYTKTIPFWSLLLKHVETQNYCFLLTTLLDFHFQRKLETFLLLERNAIVVDFFDILSRRRQCTINSRWTFIMKIEWTIFIAALQCKFAWNYMCIPMERITNKK